MAKWNEKYYRGEDQYSDGEVEEEILKMVKQGCGIDSIEKEKMSYPVMYHLSKVRENILLWYPFRENARVLEVGAGCGAITGMLCGKVKQVTAVELSKRRASVNYERNKQYENLEIWVGNLNDIPVKAEFDYIILNGVFEYAGSFTEGDRPYEAFLAALSERLVPGGLILIAIENRLGAKYLAGAPEDHTEQHFLGLKQYEGVRTVRTFSKEELKELCQRAGLCCCRFFYPYPDYKFPYEIFTDETINTTLYGRPMFQFNEINLELFSESAFMQTLAKEKVADRFANSFLVEIGKDCNDESKKVKYVKLNTDRRYEFRIYTSIWEQNGRTYVGKHPVGKEAGNHLARMVSNSKGKGKNWHYLEGEWKDGVLVYPYLDERTLDDLVAERIVKGDGEGIRSLIEHFYQTFFSDQREMEDYQDEQFCQVFGDISLGGMRGCCCDLDIDLIFDNIFCMGDQYVVIDAEWIFPFYIPVVYVMWRILNELYYRHTELDQILQKRDLEQAYGIAEEDIQVFRQWELHFAYQYVDSYGLKKYEKKPLHIALKKCVDYCKKKRHLDSRLYLNTGNGYHEEGSLDASIRFLGGAFALQIPLPTETKILSLRWDPSSFPCRCCRIDVKGDDGRQLRCHPLNSIAQEENWDLFFTNDPNYEISGDFTDVKEIHITGELFYLEEKEIMQWITDYIQKSQKSQKSRGIMSKIGNVLQKLEKK